MAPSRRSVASASSSPASGSRPSRPRDDEEPRRSRKKPKSSALVVAPEDWRSTWEMIVELRRDRTAVVDSMGSEALADETVDERTKAYQTLVSLMLSSQTKDVTTAETMRALREHGLTVDHILDGTTEEELHELIRKVGFHNNKTKFILRTTQILRDQYDSRVPDTMEALCSLPGVGPKMALIVLRVAYGITAGIAVDTHVHRIANQLRWAGPSPTKTPEQTRAALESWLPTDLWPDVNLILVGLGQEVQTEKPKLIAKALVSSHHSRALTLLVSLGLDLRKLRDRHGPELADRSGLDLPEIDARLADAGVR